jgi:preprotein translocase subunit SecE
MRWSTKLHGPSIVSLIFALFIGLIDLGFENVLDWYYNNL